MVTGVSHLHRGSRGRAGLTGADLFASVSSPDREALYFSQEETCAEFLGGVEQSVKSDLSPAGRGLATGVAWPLQTPPLKKRFPQHGAFANCPTEDVNGAHSATCNAI